MLTSVLFGSGCNQEPFTTNSYASDHKDGNENKNNIFSKLFNADAEKKILTPVDFIKWVENEDNGLKKSKTIGDYEFIVQFQPYDYVALRSIKKKEVSGKELANEKKQINGLQYFIFTIAAKGKEKDLLKSGIKTKNEYYSRIEYFSFYMQQDLKLIQNGDTLPCVLHHFERTYSIAPYKKFVLAFELPQKSEDKAISDKVFIYDDQILGTGRVKILFSGTDIKRLPGLLTKRESTIRISS